MKKSKQLTDKKIKFAYFVAILLTFGFIVPATIPAALSAYMAYATALGSLTTLLFSAHVLQRAATKDVYLKELEMENK
jgi:hypothetical protein